MTRNQTLLVGVILFLVCTGLSAWAYAQSAAVIPTHWDATGHPNGYMSRFWGLAIYPLMLAATCALTVIIPALSPKGFRLDQSIKPFHMLFVACMVFEFAIAVPAIRSAVGAPMPSIAFALVAIGLLFVVGGNIMSKFRKNFFVGIRTPWTLASDEVWLRTHRFGGWVFVIGGVLLATYGLVGVEPSVIFTIVALMVLLPVAYSYITYRQVEGFGPNGSS